MSKINHLDYAHEEKIVSKRVDMKASDYSGTIHIPTEDELISVMKRNGEPCVIDKINEIVDYINLPLYKKLFYKYR